MFRLFSDDANNEIEISTYLIIEYVEKSRKTIYCDIKNRIFLVCKKKLIELE